MSTVLYFVRHGESVTNVDGIFTGQLDFPLSELGYKQADLLVNYFKDVNIDKIYASDLGRTCATIAPTAKEHNLEIIKDKRLREVYAGKWQGETFKHIFEKYTEDYTKWRTEIVDARCTGGESFKELSERVYQAVLEIINENQGKTVIVVSHSNPIKSILLRANILGVPIKELLVAPPNCSVTKIVCENGKLKLIIKGDITHLETIKDEIKQRFA